MQKKYLIVNKMEDFKIGDTVEIVHGSLGWINDGKNIKSFDVRYDLVSRQATIVNVHKLKYPENSPTKYTIKLVDDGNEISYFSNKQLKKI